MISTANSPEGLRRSPRLSASPGSSPAKETTPPKKKIKRGTKYAADDEPESGKVTPPNSAPVVVTPKAPKKARKKRKVEGMKGVKLF
ncbi:hypothetical protein TrVE_jg8960 [Triparma verrucosa]|uniref:Uncharacterized protein n=1 Tax=Triparma verrucosa TaxID=1606542 RepID=A0A9W6ZCX8_9STRA|nr:hypothetical protein TrVE_jg8960 [Triparma verrucosa]